MLTLADIVADLGFVLAIDHCARGCEHCPAFGGRTPVQRAPLADLAHRVAAISAVRRRLQIADRRVVHCWRISDPLDYVVRLTDGRIGTCADIAGLWRSHLGQGLYVVTNGSEGSPTAARALTHLTADPELLSQIKLTITHADRDFGTPRYTAHLAEDVATLAPMWQHRSTRVEDPTGRRFRINVKTTKAREAEVRAVLRDILTTAGLAPATGDDPALVRFKPIYDLGNAIGTASPVVGAIDVCRGAGERYKPTAETRRQTQYGIRPNGHLFAVDMYAFTERDLGGPGRPVHWPDSLDDADLYAPLTELAHA
jgi:hypothetical protein